MPTEKTLQAQIVKRLQSKGHIVYKFASPAHRGVPDLLVIADGRVVFLEVKHPNGKGRLSKLQEITINEMRQHGGEVHVINSLEYLDTIFNFH
jgi:Holliday junction resolvase